MSAGACREIHQGADHPRPVTSGVACDQGVKVILGAKHIADMVVLRQQPHAADGEGLAAGSVEQIVEVQGLVRPVKPADSDMDDTRRQTAPIIGRNLDIRES